MDRRQFLSTSGAAFGLGLVTSGSPAAAFAQTSAKGSGDAALNALFEEIFKEQVADSPELATSLGLDKGPNAVKRASSLWLGAEIAGATASGVTMHAAVIANASR